MSTTSPSSSVERSAGGAVSFGVSIFAGVMLVTLALLHVLQGIAAIAEDDVYVTGVSYTYELDVTAWGWIHLVMGVIGVAIGVGLLLRQSWALMAGIVIAVISGVANFAFMPYYPFWALLILAFDVVVIWALAKQLSVVDRPTY